MRVTGLHNQSDHKLEEKLDTARNRKLNLSKKPWLSAAAFPLTERNLNLLFEGAIPAILLKQFVSAKTCSIIVENLRRLGMGTYSHVSHAVGRMGLAQMEYHLKGSKAGYFEKVPDARAKYQQAIANALDPVRELVNVLDHVTEHEVKTACETGFGEMFAGTFRNVMTVGHKHFDYAPFEAQGWDISKIESQLSWNLYLNQPQGGDLVAYNRPYHPADEQLRVEGQYYYDNSIVSGAEAFRYTPRIGDVVIFNSRNIHEVEPVLGDRFSLSSFIGREKNKNLVFWS